MNGLSGLLALSSGAILVAVGLIACSSVEEQPKAAPPAAVQPAAKAEAKSGSQNRNKNHQG